MSGRRLASALTLYAFVLICVLSLDAAQKDAMTWLAALGVAAIAAAAVTVALAARA